MDEAGRDAHMSMLMNMGASHLGGQSINSIMKQTEETMANVSIKHSLGFGRAGDGNNDNDNSPTVHYHHHYFHLHHRHHHRHHHPCQPPHNDPTPPTNHPNQPTNQPPRQCPMAWEATKK